MARNCTECGQPIVLIPSAAERSQATGMPASHFEDQFTMHAECLLALRQRETAKLIERRFPRQGASGWLVVTHIGDR